MSTRRKYASEGRTALSTGRAVRLGIVTGLLSFSLLLVASRLWRSNGASSPNPPVRPHDATVDVWVGEWTPGVTCVLASPWNQRTWDAASDATLRSSGNSASGTSALGRSAPGRATSGATGLPSDLVLYDCWLFNTTDHPVTVTLKDGSLVVTPGPSATALPLRSLSSWLTPASGAEAPLGGPATVLRALGAGRDTIELPPGRMTRHPVALSERVSLEGVQSVATADGTSFHKRPMPEPEWAALTQSPRLADLEKLR